MEDILLVLYSQRALDRERDPNHVIRILAIDDGEPPNTATATLEVTVDDVNDNAPTFLKVQVMTLPCGSIINQQSTIYIPFLLCEI